MGIRVYLSNLAAYNNGEAKGSWFVLPADEDVVFNCLGLSSEHPDYAVHDYEAPFRIDEFISIAELNELAEMYEEMSGSMSDAMIGELASELGSVESAYEVFCNSQLSFYEASNDEEVAMAYVDQMGGLEELPHDVLVTYFDWEAFSLDLMINNHFVKVNDCYILIEW